MDVIDMPHLSPMRDSYIQRLFENADRIEALKEKHNVSISITEACSPDSIKKEWRAAHLRSNSDVTPKCVCPASPAPPRALPPRKSHPRSHSLGARPGQKNAMKHQSLSIPVQRSSMGHLAIEFSPHVEISTLSSILAKCEKSVTPKCSPRRICSERTSPNVSVISIAEANPILLKVTPIIKDKSSSQLVYVPSDPWTKMSDNDSKNRRLARPNHHSLDYSSADAGPWVLHDSALENAHSQRRIYRKSRSLTKQKNYFDCKRQESLPSALQVGSDAVVKVDRHSPISCDTCWSSDSCKCLKSNANNLLKNSPTAASECKPLEVVLSCQASPSHYYADRMYGVGKKSPVFLKNQTKSPTIASKSPTETSQSNKLDPACLCSKSVQSTSPRPSPRRTSNYKSPVDSAVEITEKEDNKKVDTCDGDNVESLKTATEVLQSEKDPVENRSSKLISVCDPLLETTC